MQLPQGISIELGKKAASDELVRLLVARISENAQLPHKLRTLRALRGTLVIVEREDIDSGQGSPRRTLTLRFDFGRVSLQLGRVGRPDLTFWGTREALLLLPSRWDVLSHSALVALRPLGLLVPGSGLEVFGGLVHPIFLARLARVLGPVDP